MRGAVSVVHVAPPRARRSAAENGSLICLAGAKPVPRAKANLSYESFVRVFALRAERLASSC